MLEQDATPVSDLYPTWCAVGQEHDIHGHLCGQSETIQGICSHRYNLRLVSLGYSLGNVFNRRIDNAKSIFLVLFGLIVNAMSQPYQHSVGVHSMEC